MAIFKDEDLGASISVNPLTVFVLQEGTVLQEATVLEESADGLIEGQVLHHDGEIVIECKADDFEDQTSREEVGTQDRLICSVCKAEFLQEDDLDNHKERCSKVYYICTLCKEHFNSEESLKLHYRLHSDERVTCGKCGKSIKSPETVETHKKECMSVSCVLCNKLFQSKALLNTHLIEVHSEAKVFETGEPSQLSSLEERYKCRLCPRSFTRVGSLNYHVSRKHSGTEKERKASDFPYLCPECGNRYKSGTQLCRHRRWECGKEPMFKCQLCVKKFHHRHGLKQHIRLHLAKKGVTGRTAQFCCEKCGRGYKLKSSLNNHIKWECGKEPVFACTLCYVKFSHKGNLKKHIVTKHGGNVQNIL